MRIVPLQQDAEPILTPDLVWNGTSGDLVIVPHEAVEVLDDVGPFQISERMANVSRASSAAYYDAGGVLRMAGPNTPRMDHDPATRAARGMLLEPSAINLVLQSQNFQTAWTSGGAALTPNAIAAPDGTTTATKIVENSGTTSGGIIQSGIAVATGSVYTASAFFKAGEITQAAFYLPADRFGAIQIVIFDLVSGTVVSTTGGAVGSIWPAGNGWWRCVAVLPATTSAGASQLRIYPAINGSTGAAGDGVSGFFVWGVQLEVGAGPTSYIPTTSAAAERSAETMIIRSEQESDWRLRRDDGSIVEVNGIFGDLVFQAPSSPVHLASFSKTTRRFVSSPGAGDLRSSQALATAVLICLQTDRRVDPSELPDGETNRGWPGDAFDMQPGEQPLGSKLWLLRRRALITDTEILAADYAREALQTLIDQGAVSRVDVSCLARPDAHRIDIDVSIYARDGSRTFSQRYAVLWDQVDGI